MMKILLADDDETVLMMTAAILRKSGYEVIECTNGQEALEAIERHIIVCVITDGDMPVMDGYELIARLREKDSDLPIMIRTSNPDEPRAKHANCHISKGEPFGAQHLHRMGQMIEYLRAKRQLDVVIDGIIRTDAFGKINMFNRAAEQMFGYRAHEVMGRNINLLMPDDTALMHPHHMERYLATGRPSVVGMSGRELAGRRKDGTHFPVDIGMSELRLDEQHPEFIAVLHDITLRKKKEKEWRELATRDPLTGLANRLALGIPLELSVKRLTRPDSLGKLGVIIADLDHFKSINDTHGHQTGDAVIKEFARILTGNVLRQSDLTVRYGGEEFAIILFGAELDQTAKAAERIRKQTEATSVPAENGTIHFTASFGCAVLNRPSTDEERNNYLSHPDLIINKLLARADKALYAAKASGRNRVCVSEE